MFHRLHLRRTTDIKEGGEEMDIVVEGGVDMIEDEDGKMFNETFVTRYSDVQLQANYRYLNLIHIFHHLIHESPMS
jgi:hypothetical protein